MFNWLFPELAVVLIGASFIPLCLWAYGEATKKSHPRNKP